MDSSHNFGKVFALYSFICLNLAQFAFKYLKYYRYLFLENIEKYDFLTAEIFLKFLTQF